MAEEKAPRQKRLPGTEDAKIEALEGAAKDYAKARDRRQHLTEQEVNEKQRLLALMKKNGKKKYVHAGITIEVIPEGEKLRVRIEDEND